MSKETGGPAFPIGSGDMRDPSGMTLRDYFAAKAMQSLLSSCDVSKHGYNTELDRRAVQAYLAADAMLKARGE